MAEDDEKDTALGAGWISDDSSWYGSEDEQERQRSLCHDFTPKAFWSSHDNDLNAIISPARIHQIAEATSVPDISTPAKNAGSYRLDRKIMEEERLARLKRKRSTSPDPPSQTLEKFNPRQGCSDSWQLGESAEDFIRRLPPVTTSIFTCEWIWAANPYRDTQDKSACPRVADFRERGNFLLEHSLQVRRDIQKDDTKIPKGVMTLRLNQESKALQQRLTDLAVESGVLSGKWMLFLKLEDVTRVWTRIVDAVTTNRLGPIAKIAPDKGMPGERLLCIYTRDFRDEADVLRVLQELVAMGFAKSGKPLYYKSDAYTYLDIYARTATDYGLQASLYSSLEMLAEARLPRLTSIPPRKQVKLATCD